MKFIDLQPLIRYQQILLDYPLSYHTLHMVVHFQSSLNVPRTAHSEKRICYYSKANHQASKHQGNKAWTLRCNSVESDTLVRFDLLRCWLWYATPRHNRRP